MEENQKKEQKGRLSIRKKRSMIYFIEATEKLIREEGVDGLSIRKIAAEAGYNSATLYNYFEDLEHLILFASVRHLREYTEALKEATKGDMNALELYRRIYLIFCGYSFRSPEIFYNLFFGRYSNKLGEVMRQYYELFPDELGEHNSFVRGMLSQSSIYKRDQGIMEELMREGYVRPEKKNSTIQVIVRLHQTFLTEACNLGEALDVEEHVEKFMELFDYMMEAAR